MSVILALLGISILILVHEFGHLIVAKRSGIRVHEFGIGFPPRALTLFRRGETVYTLNWIPFGGFVRMAGEQDADTDETGRFDQATRWQQAKVLFAGPLMNIVIGLILTFAGLMLGTLAPADAVSDAQAQNIGTYIVQVRPNGPAEGILRPGMKIAGIATHTVAIPDPSVQDVIQTIQAVPAGESITLTVQTTQRQATVSLTPETLESGVQGIGVGLDSLAVVRPSIGRAFVETFTQLPSRLWSILSGLGHFFGGIFTGSAWSQVSGPVGIVQVAAASNHIGFGVFLLFLAFLSYNLAVLNLLPIPALDGGRLLIVAIEAVIRRKLRPRIVGYIHTITFLLLIALMVAVTAQDIWRLF